MFLRIECACLGLGLGSNARARMMANRPLKWRELQKWSGLDERSLNRALYELIESKEVLKFEKKYDVSKRLSEDYDRILNQRKNRLTSCARAHKNQTIITDLSDVNVFIGPNNAGKSNILEALRFIEYLTRGQREKSYSEMVFDGKTSRNIQFTLTFSLSIEERREFITKLFLKNSKINTDEAIKSAFLSTLTYDAVLGKSGLIKEKLTTRNILKGDLIIIQGTPDKGRTNKERLCVDRDLPR